MRVTVAQINPVVGAIEENVARVLGIVETARDEQADLVVFPEMVITGYPPRDLLELPAFVDEAGSGLERVREASGNCPGLGIIVGCPVPTHLEDGKPLYNSAILMESGQVLFQQPKMLLPTYDVFDEARYFRPAEGNETYRYKDVTLGLSICEDLWFEPDPWNTRPYAFDPIDSLAGKNATLLINISASPFAIGKEETRFDLIRNHTLNHKAPFLFVNQVGGNDELVFDGRSLYVDERGKARHVFPSFEEAVRTIDTNDGGEGRYEFEDHLETVFKALVLGTRDYLAKCSIPRVVIGLSGGIDSAVTAAIAWFAVGAENMLLVAMPSPYSSGESLEDARAIATSMGVELRTIGIEPVMKAYDEILAESLRGTSRDVTEENIQARIRGNILMAISNKLGHLPLSTGNKSELAVGYCTLYGDMSGGLAVISDVPKTMVYSLARLINQKKRLIPERVIGKEPSAELKPDQRDVDVLPPYEILDPILEDYIDRQRSVDEIVAKGFERRIVEWVARTVRANEYKRKQAAPGIKVTSKAFGSGRRMPIAARYDT